MLCYFLCVDPRMILRVTRSLWSLLDSEIDFIARGLTKMIESQPPAELPVDNSKAVAASQGSFYSFTPYDAVPRGLQKSWLFSGLVTGAASVVHLDMLYMHFIL